MSESVDVTAGGCGATLEAWLTVLLETPSGVQAAGRTLLGNPGHLSSSGENPSAPGHSPGLRAPERIGKPRSHRVVDVHLGCQPPRGNPSWAPALALDKN